MNTNIHLEGLIDGWGVDLDRARRPAIQIQLPLTRYRPQDIVLLHSISALPDGSGSSTQPMW